MKKSIDINIERSILFGPKCNDSHIDDIIKQLFHFDKDDGSIFFHINSSGGNFPATEKLYEHIRLRRNEVIGIVAGSCFGSVAVLLQACDKRYATPLSSFQLFYSGQHVVFGVIGDKPVDQYLDVIKRKIDLAGKYRSKTLNMLKRKMTIDEKHIHDLLIQESNLDAEEAKRIGLIDGIIDM
jgi:ATP-dependent protease ClpP protease subunit